MRSQPQKKFIVEFEGSEQSVSNLATFGNFGKGSVKEDIKITIKKTERRESVEFPRTKQIEQEKQAGNRAKENKQSNEEVLVHTNLTSASKRKQALEDYIGGAKKMDYGN